MTTTQRPQKLPAPPDERESTDQLSMFGVSGQLALPNAPAQLGLDGIAYAPAAPNPEGVSPLLGNATPTFQDSPDEVFGCEPPTWRRNLVEYERRLREQLAPRAPQRQLVLDEAIWQSVPRQLELWPRLDARLPLVPERQQKCQRTRYIEGGEVGLVMGKTGRWHLSGVVSCGRYTCPACGPWRSRDVASLLGACFERHRERSPEGDHWMLTHTVPHRLADDMEAIGWLYAALARFWASRTWERFADRWGIEAKVRAFDATHGGVNGAHSHFHTALFIDRAMVPLATVARLSVAEIEQRVRRERWERRRARQRRRGMTTKAEREEDAAWEQAAALELMQAQALYEAAWAAVKVGEVERMPLRECSQAVRQAFLVELCRGLVAAWRESLAAVGCPYPASSNSIDLLPAEKAETYFVKWGLAEEVGLGAEKDRSHLRLLDVVAARLGEPSDVAGDLYHRFNEAMRGRAWVTGLKAACDRLGVTEDDARAYVERMRERRKLELERAGQEPAPELEPRYLVVRAWLWSAFLERGHAEVFAWLDERVSCMVSTDEIQVQLDAFLQSIHGPAGVWDSS